jgi:hypothetical protein
LDIEDLGIWPGERRLQKTLARTLCKQIWVIFFRRKKFLRIFWEFFPPKWRIERRRTAKTFEGRLNKNTCWKMESAGVHFSREKSDKKLDPFWFCEKQVFFLSPKRLFWGYVEICREDSQSLTMPRDMIVSWPGANQRLLILQLCTPPL